MRIFSILSLLVLCAVDMTAQTMSYDLTKQQPVYSETVGYGYDVVEAPIASLFVLAVRRVGERLRFVQNPVG